MLGILTEYSQGLVPPVKDEPDDIFLGHLGKLLGEEGLEADELGQRLGTSVVPDGAPFDFVIGIARTWGCGAASVGADFCVEDFCVEASHGRYYRLGGLSLRPGLEIDLYRRVVRGRRIGIRSRRDRHSSYGFDGRQWG